MLSTAAGSRYLITRHHPFCTTQTLSGHVWVPPRWGAPRIVFHHLGNAFSSSFLSTSTETHHKPPKRKQGIILEGSQAKEGSSPSSSGISASRCCLCICHSIPSPCPRGSLPYCSLIALLRKRGALTAWLMSTGGIDPFGWRETLSPKPKARTIQLFPRAWASHAVNPTFGAVGFPRHPPRYRCSPKILSQMSAWEPPMLAQLFLPPASPQSSCDPSPASPGPSRRCRSRSGAERGGRGAERRRRRGGSERSVPRAPGASRCR